MSRQPIGGKLGFAGRVHDIDLPIARLTSDVRQLIGAQSLEDLVKIRAVSEVEKGVVDPQATVQLDYRHHLRQAFGEAEIIAPGAEPGIGGGAPQCQGGASRQHPAIAAAER